MEKIKITQKELEETYDIEKPKEEVKETSEANATVEEYTTEYDEKELKEWRKENE